MGKFSIITVDDLTKFVKKYKEVEEKLKINVSMVERIVQYNLNIPLPLTYNYIKVGESNIHGKGIFATEKIPMNSIITYYPAHCVCINNGYYFPKNNKDITFKKNIEENNYDKIYGFSGYARNSIEDDRITIIGNPNNTKNSLLLGHLINDAGGNVFKNISYDELDGIKFKNAIAHYYINGKAKRNCKIATHKESFICYVIAVRDILEGEELLTLYDPIYWFDINYNKNAYTDNIAINKFQKIFNEETFVKWFKNIYSE